MRGMVLILLALFIDGLQGLLTWAFVAMGSALTAATPLGAAVGCGLAGVAANGVVTGATAAIGCAAASPIGVPLGIGMSFVTDICLSATLGSGLVLLLAFNGMFYGKTIGAGAILECIPGFDVFPGWTAMTIRCVFLKAQEEGTLGETVLGKLASKLSNPATVLGGAVGGMVALNQSTRMMANQNSSPRQKTASVASQLPDQTKAPLKDIDGVRRPANDNYQTQVYAA